MNAQVPEPGLDRQVALLRVGGDEELLKEIAVIFLEDYPRVLAEIRDAIASNDAKQLEAAAHTLKGSVGNFGAAAVVASALRLEQMGRTAQLEQSAEVLHALEAGLSVLHVELAIDLDACRYRQAAQRQRTPATDLAAVEVSIVVEVEAWRQRNTGAGRARTRKVDAGRGLGGFRSPLDRVEHCDSEQ